MRIVIALFLFVVAIQAACAAPEGSAPARTSEFQQAALDIDVEGIKLGMTPEQVTAPGAKLVPESALDNPQAKVVGYHCDGFQQLGMAMLSFCDGKLYRINVAYDPDTLQKIGGWEAIHHRMVATLGESRDSEGSAVWTFLDVDRAFFLKNTKGTVILSISNLAIEREVRQRKSNVGF